MHGHGWRLVAKEHLHEPRITKDVAMALTGRIIALIGEVAIV